MSTNELKTWLEVWLEELRSDANCEGLAAGYRSACVHHAARLESIIDAAESKPGINVGAELGRAVREGRATIQWSEKFDGPDLPDGLDDDEAIAAITRARDTAMEWTAKGRIPECGEFGTIAQDLDAVLFIIEARTKKEA